MGCRFSVPKQLEEIHESSGNPQDLFVVESINPSYAGGKATQVTRKDLRQARKASIMAAARSVAFEELVSIQIVQGRIAQVTLLHGGSRARNGNEEEDDQRFEWGTRMGEHRINPPLISALNKALDTALGNPEIAMVVVVGEGRFFCNGMDLQWIKKHPASSDQLQQDAEMLMARILTFPLPTLAAINGHFCAAGGMLGLCFDKRVMVAERGLFFVPAIDLGLVYSPGMTELMKSKTPVRMQNDMIAFAAKYTAEQLVELGVVDASCAAGDLVSLSIARALSLTDKGRFTGERYRETMHEIKKNLYAEAYRHLMDPNSFQGMGFDQGKWDEHGKVVKSPRSSKL